MIVPAPNVADTGKKRYLSATLDALALEAASIVYDASEERGELQLRSRRKIMII